MSVTIGSSGVPVPGTTTSTIPNTSTTSNPTGADNGNGSTGGNFSFTDWLTSKYTGGHIGFVSKYLGSMGYKIGKGNYHGIDHSQLSSALRAFMHGVDSHTWNTHGYGSYSPKAAKSGGGGTPDPSGFATNQSFPNTFGNLSAPDINSILGSNAMAYTNPDYYATVMAGSQYDPTLNQLAQNKSDVAAMMPKIQAAIDQAYGGAQAAAQARAGQDMAAGQGAVGGMAGLGSKLGALFGLQGSGDAFANLVANNAGAAQNQAAANAASDNADANALQGREAALKVNTQNEYNQKMQDINNAIAQAKSSKGQEYAKQLIQGLGFKQQLMSQALANRGAMLNQDELAQMGGLQLAAQNIANTQASQNVNTSAQNANDAHLNADLQRQQAVLAQAGITSWSQMGATQQASLGPNLLQGMVGADPTSGRTKLVVNASQALTNILAELNNMFPNDRNNPALRAYAQTLVNQYR